MSTVKGASRQELPLVGPRRKAREVARLFKAQGGPGEGKRAEVPYFVLRHRESFDFRVASATSYADLAARDLARGDYELDTPHAFPSWDAAEGFVRTGRVPAGTPAHEAAPAAVAEPPALEAALARHFGHPAFRPGQRALIEAVLAGEDALGVLPTGTGKSLTYQLPALLLPGLTLVISPLKALMKDQYDGLMARGIPATAIHSDLEPGEVRRRTDALRAGRFKLAFVAPERFATKAFRHALGDLEVSLFAVDEAHCISEWGHDFRPSYLQLPEAIAALGRPPVLAVTATATGRVRAEITDLLGLRSPRTVITGFDRPNFTYEVRQVADQRRRLELARAVLAERPGASIMYVGAQSRTEEAARELRRCDLAARAFHAGLPAGEKRATQEAFMAGELRVVVATTAFGMGVDKADVRSVVHLDLPRSIEQYYQEAGRAGRDGDPALCVLITTPDDAERARYLIGAGYPDPRLVEVIHRFVRDKGGACLTSLEALAWAVGAGDKVRGVETALRSLAKRGWLEAQTDRDGTLRLVVLRADGHPYDPETRAADARRKQRELDRFAAVEDLVLTTGCRRAAVLRYFGEAAQDRCGRCDRCLAPKVRRLGDLVPAITGDTQACPFCHAQVRTAFLAAHCREVHGKLPDGREPEVTRVPCPFCGGRVRREEHERHVRTCQPRRR